MAPVDLSINSVFSVKGKVALVTGGGSGIGKAISAALVQNGVAKVYIAARKEAQLEQAVKELNSMREGSVEYIVANLNSKAGVDKLVEEVKRRTSKIHILVNNSGVSWGAPFREVPEQQGWDNVMAVNVKSIFYLTVGLVDLLTKDSTAYDPAHVINISSTASVTPHTESVTSADGNGTIAYNVSKAAVNHLTSILAVKLGPSHVCVNAICPGIFPSKMTAFAFKTSGEEKIAEHQPTGRTGIPQDLAGIALFLSSSASAHVTGAHILLDGGHTLALQGIAPQTKL